MPRCKKITASVGKKQNAALADRRAASWLAGFGLKQLISSSVDRSRSALVVVPNLLSGSFRISHSDTLLVG